MKKCQRCGASFKTSMKIDGKKRSLSSRKLCLDCSPFGSHNTTPGGIPGGRPVGGDKICCDCGNPFPKHVGFYFDTTNQCLRSICKQCVTKRTLAKNRAMKRRMVEYKGGKCVICGYNRNPAGFDFHHTDPTKKDLALGKMRNRSFDKIKQELDKCILVCATCHREIHYPMEENWVWMPDGLHRKKWRLSNPCRTQNWKLECQMVYITKNVTTIEFLVWFSILIWKTIGDPKGSGAIITRSGCWLQLHRCGKRVRLLAADKNPDVCSLKFLSRECLEARFATARWLFVSPPLVHLIILAKECLDWMQDGTTLLFGSTSPGATPGLDT